MLVMRIWCVSKSQALTEMESMRSGIEVIDKEEEEE